MLGSHSTTSTATPLSGASTVAANSRRLWLAAARPEEGGPPDPAPAPAPEPPTRPEPPRPANPIMRGMGQHNRLHLCRPHDRRVPQALVQQRLEGALVDSWTLGCKGMGGGGGVARRIRFLPAPQQKWAVPFAFLVVHTTPCTCLQYFAPASYVHRGLEAGARALTHKVTTPGHDPQTRTFRCNDDNKQRLSPPLRNIEACMTPTCSPSGQRHSREGRRRCGTAWSTSVHTPRACRRTEGEGRSASASAQKR